jgi:hypothetical protein
VYQTMCQTSGKYWYTGARYCCQILRTVVYGFILLMALELKTYNYKLWMKTIITNKNSVAFSPQANYTDWVTVTSQWILVPTFVDRRVSRGQRGGSSTVVNLDRGCYFSFKQLLIYPHETEWILFQTQCYSENLVAPGIEPGTSGFAPRNHRGNRRQSNFQNT